MDAVARLGAIGCAHANRDELRFEWTFRTVAPGDATPGPFTAAGDDVFGGAARVRRQRVNPSWTKRRRSGHSCTCIDGVQLLLRDDPDRPEQAFIGESASKLAADAVAGVRKYSPETHALLLEDAHFIERDAPLRPERDVFRNTDFGSPFSVGRPRLRQEQPQGHRYRN